MPEACATCKFYMNGECHFDAPKSIKDVSTAWPPVSSDFWCAEYLVGSRGSQRCGTCYFCRRTGVDCHYNAPQFPAEAGAVMPPVAPDLWCGRYSTVAKVNPLTLATQAEADAQTAITNAQSALAQITALSLSDQWLSYDPTVWAANGTINRYTAIGKYKRLGSLLACSVHFALLDNGTGNTSLICSLPLPVKYPDPTMSSGIGMRGDGAAFTVVTSPAAQIVVARLYDGSYPGLSGYAFDFNVVYEPEP